MLARPSPLHRGRSAAALALCLVVAAVTFAPVAAAASGATGAAVGMPAAATAALPTTSALPSDDPSVGVAPAAELPTTRLVALETHGYLRLRGQGLRNGGLGAGGNGTPATLHRLGLRPDGADMALVDTRLRLDPTLHLGARARLDMQLDLSGALIFGAQSSAGAAAGPLVGTFGGTALGDLITVRRAWATFDLLGLAELIIGRTGDHFGLGIWRNDGRDPWADFQSDVDRVALRAELLGFRIWVSRDALVTLPTLRKGSDGDDLSYGPQDATDVIRYTAQVEGGAAKPGDRGLYWGAAVGYHTQDLGLRVEHEDATAATLKTDCVNAGTCVQLVARDAMLVVPQGTVAYNGQTSLGELTAQGEVVARFASFANTDALPRTDTSTTLLGGAIAGRVSLRRGSQRWQLRAGWATGDALGGFGVLDQANLAVVDPISKELVHRKLVTGMAMHRGFLVGGILFREVIGAVANAWYARPAWRLHLSPETATSGVSAEIGCLVAGASQWGSTPGKRSFLGLEPELRIDARLGTWGRAMLRGGVLLPGAAFDAGRDGTSAEPAMRVSASWIVDF